MSTETKEISSSEIITGGVDNDNNDNNLIGDIFLSDEFDYSCGELFNPNNINNSNENNSSIFPPKFITQSQLSYSSPSDCSFDDDHHALLFTANNAIATENRLSQASFILEYQQLYNCYTMCLTTLQDSVKEVEALRDENESLRAANGELLNRLSLFSSSTRMMSSFVPNVSLIGEFSRLGIGSAFCESNHNNGEEFPSVSPTSVIEPNQFVRGDQRGLSMPKSISVRSKGYLKSVAATQRPIRQQNTNQQVRVAGEKKPGEGMEFEVYNQGMSKTELCNKWQETGSCPYGDNCHFAHGVSELRPVIRHPRYKTEVCRMVLAGDICPYGHRCHFRHSLTNEEMLMGVNRS